MSVEDKFSMVASESHIVVSLHDPIKSTNWDEIERVGSAILEQLKARKSPKIAIDLSDLDYMGSSVVALMVRVWKETQTDGGMMVVVTRHSLVLEVLTLAGLGKVWTIVDSLEEAFDALGVSDAAVVQQRETRLLTFVGPVAAVGASVGLAVLLNASDEPQEYVGVIGAFGCAILALCTSGVSVFRESGGKRNLSLAVVVWSIIVLAYAGLHTNRNPPTIFKTLFGSKNEEPPTTGGGLKPGSSAGTESDTASDAKEPSSKTSQRPNSESEQQATPDAETETPLEDDPPSDNDGGTDQPKGPPSGVDLNPDGSDNPVQPETDESSEKSDSPEATAEQLILPPEDSDPSGTDRESPDSSTESGSPDAPPLPENA